MIDSSTMINMINSPYNLEMAIYIYIGLATFSALVIFLINKQIAKFTTLNTSLPFLDVATDLKAFLVYLLYEDHPYWAYLTLLWVVFPLLLHLVKYIFLLCTAYEKADILDVLYQFPLFRPVRNLYLAFKLYRMAFGTKTFDYKNWKDVEDIQREVAAAGLTESFYEAGPQSVQQLVIGFSTGRFPVSVIIGIVVSILSLGWGASRAFFLERVKDESDPDPSPSIVARDIFPKKLVVLFNSLFMWVLIASLLGPYTFVALPIVFAVSYFSIGKFAKKKLGGEDRGTAFAGETRCCVKKIDIFRLKGAIISLWLPSVVGDRENMYMVSATSVLLSKLLTLVVALIIGMSGLQPQMHSHPTVIWCEQEWSEKAQEGVTLCSFDNNNLTYCLDQVNLQQMVRVCSSGIFERNFWIGLFIAIIFTNTASLYASYRLNWLANYINMFKETKSLHR